MTKITAYARELQTISVRSQGSRERQNLIASAKDAGINVRALRKVAREILMEPKKLQPLPLRRRGTAFLVPNEVVDDEFAV